MPTEIITFPSRCLRNNPLGDPFRRRIPIFFPPSYAHSPTRRYPVIYFLSGFTGSGLTNCNVGAWTESLPERCDRLMRAKKMPEAIVVMPDCFTAYGGSQYINSSATGRYMDHLVKELVPWVDAHLRILPGARHRGIMGKSSGGFGALTIAMRCPGVFGAVSAHSSDMYFDYCYKADFPKALAVFDRYGHSTAKFLRAWRKMPKQLSGDLHGAVMLAAMASCYSPNPRSALGFNLPFDLTTGAVRPAVWRRWLQWDPTICVQRYAANLRRLRWLYLECGSHDEYHLQYGHRIFIETLKRLRIRHRYEEFPDGHSNTQYRYDRALPLLARHLR